MLHDKLLFYSQNVSSVLTAYLMCGAPSSGVSNIIQKTTNEDTVSTNIAATMSVSKHSAASTSSSTKGYLLGGYTGSANTSDIDSFIRSTETNNNVSANLSTAVRESCGASSTTKGYALGGYTSAATNTVKGVNFSDDTAFLTGTTIAAATRQGSTRGAEYNSVTYFPYNYTTAYSSAIGKFDKTTDTGVTLSATLSLARGETIGVIWGSTNAYFGGGLNSTVKNDIDGLALSTETAINPSSVLSIARRATVGSNGITNGVFNGGGDASTTRYNRRDSLDFSTESITIFTYNLASNLAGNGVTQ